MKILTKGSYYGAMHREQQIKGILFSEYNYLIDKTDWHYHEKPYFMYVLEGNLYDVNKITTTNCPSGSFLLHNWQEPHFNAKESSNARGFHIEFDKDWFQNNNIDINVWEGSQLIKNPKLHHILAKLYAEFKTADTYSDVSAELLLSELCENLGQEKVYVFENNPAWLSTLVEIIHFTNEPFCLTTLSDQLNIHPGHLSRAIPKYFSTTLGDYIRQIKIKKLLMPCYLIKNHYLILDMNVGFLIKVIFLEPLKGIWESLLRRFRRNVNNVNFILFSGSPINYFWSLILKLKL